MLELKNIKKSYVTGDTTTHALDDVSVSFGECEFVAILGTSGSGKTTMLNVIGGLDCYDSGDLVISGRSTKQYKSRDWDTYRNHSIGFVFQSYNLIPHQSVLSNVELALTLSGVPKAERRRRAKEALCRVGLGDQMKKKPSQMSGGQMQRVAIARALVNDPEILLADEPTGALDTATSVQIMELLREISQSKLVIMVTHNPDLAHQYATRIVQLSDGKIISDEPNTPSCDVQKVEDNKASEMPKSSDKAKKKKESRTSMSFFTALSLSLNNLMTKKARTILTSFAGSIGIIGIALILAISSGIQAYIDRVQEDTLSGYPITLTEQTVDLNEMMAVMAEAEETPDHDMDKVYASSQIKDMFDSLYDMETGTNNLKAFKDHIEENETLKDYASSIQYSYNTELLIYGYDENGKMIKVNPSTIVDTMYAAMGVSYDANSLSGAMISQGQATTMAVWTEMMPQIDGLGINDLVKEQYDIVEGHWPESYDEIVLVLDKNNEISDMYLYSLGMKDQGELDSLINGTAENDTEDEELSWSYDELIGKKFYATLPAQKYSNKNDKNVWEDMSENEDYMAITAEQGLQLKICGIIRPNPEAAAPSIKGAIGYTADLTKHLIDLTNETEIVKLQTDNPEVDVFTGLPFKGDREEPSAEEKASSFKEYAASLSTDKAAELYVSIASAIPEETLIMQTAEAMGQFPDRAAMEETVIATYTQSSGADEEKIKGYIANMTDEELEGAIREGIEKQITEKYAETVKTQLSALDTNSLSAMLMGAIAQADSNTLVKYYDDHMPASYSEATFDENMRKLSAVNLEEPSAINIFATSFEAKDGIAEIISDYNKTVDEADQITYTDFVAIIMSSITTIINAISYVLISFVSISLVVSSIMIGIITYISVLERTKEIGILRAIGASKKDVTRVFNAETLIVGLCAGLLGIGVTELLSIPINIIIEHLTDISNVAALPWQGAVVLVIISVVLTVVAGLFPSLLAAKKDPVVALRSE